MQQDGIQYFQLAVKCCRCGVVTRVIYYDVALFPAKENRFESIHGGDSGERIPQLATEAIIR